MRKPEIVKQGPVITEEAREDRAWEGWMHDFIRDLVRCRGHVTRAIERNERCRYTIYVYRDKFKDYAKCWDSVVEGFEVMPSRPESGRKDRSRNVE